MLKKIILTATIFSLLPLMALAYDYTQGCVQGYFVPDEMCEGIECSEASECEVNLCFADECEEPLKGNSHYTGNNCIFTPFFQCSCNGSCTGYGDCVPSGNCWYECDEGYYYEEGECIFGEPPPIKYTCSLQYECVEDPEGEFETLQECENVCTMPPPPSSIWGISMPNFSSQLKGNIGEVFSDLSVVFALIIALPIAFWFIEKVISLLRV